MTDDAKGLSIYEKLAKVQEATDFLKKENASYGAKFNYVSSSQVLSAVRGTMREVGLILVPRIVGVDVGDHATAKGAHWYFTQLTMTMTWVNVENPEEKVECPWYGQGLDDGEKGVGKALTYAEKYFMLKFFNIPTDKDDPDAAKPAPPRSEPPGKPGRRRSVKEDPPWVKHCDKELQGQIKEMGMKALQLDNLWDEVSEGELLPEEAFVERVKARHTEWKEAQDGS